jgi:hypothetical protein
MAIDTRGFAFPKPSSKTREKCDMPNTAVKIMGDGREVCRKSIPGREEYKRRREQMYDRDKGICCICHEKIKDKAQATFEHGNGRGHGGSIRDDRIDIKDKHGRYINGVAHWSCNSSKGSKRYTSTTPAEAKNAKRR